MKNSPADIFSNWSRMIEADRSLFSGFGERYLWTISGPEGGVWVMSIGAERPLQQQPPGSAGGSIRCRLQCDCETLSAIALGALNPQAALAAGKLNISGPTPELIELNFILEKLIPGCTGSEPELLQ